MAKIIIFLWTIILPTLLHGQYFAPNPVEPTNAETRMQKNDELAEPFKNSILEHYPVSSIGPSVFGGRVIDLAVNPKNPNHFYIAYASGGLWVTQNNGQKFTPIFDHERVITIGAIAVDWTNDIIYVGTGEVNSSRSSYAGVGIYKSADQGKSWQHLGLSESHHIAKIKIDPSDSKILHVAVLGHLYSSNPERGYYRSADGGLTWDRKLFVDDQTGAIDFIFDVDNPNILYLATWERARRAWDFLEGGHGSKIYKSTDGGLQWANLSTSAVGFPFGPNCGRIGLAQGKTEQGKSVLYALVDNYDRRPKSEKKMVTEEGLTKDTFRNMSTNSFLSIPQKKIEEFLEKQGFPKKYSYDFIKEQMQKGSVQPADISKYLDNANALLFETEVIGGELYQSLDEGKTWSKTHDGFLDGLYYSYGYYFGRIEVSPIAPHTIYIMGVPILRSEDHGKTWTNINKENVHVDHHCLWINPENPNHLINGNDGGLNISYDKGENWVKCNTPAVGQFYYIAADQAEPYRVYGGLQDNGVWYGDHNYSASVEWHNSGRYPYQEIMGGDGMQIMIDPRDNNTVYTGFQFGNYYRINLKTEERTYITPQHELGDHPYRWNWQTPIHLSTHQPDILYMGANRVLRSFDQGKTFDLISPDLTKGGKKGDVAFGTLTCLHESSLKFGIIYVGSDDGLVHVSKDGGVSWTNITAGLPQDLWVSRIQASSHKEGRVFVALNGYRWDHFTPYIYVSDDFGTTWQKITDGLPHEPVNVIKEDPNDEQILYAGTDQGMFVSFDLGKNFSKFSKNLPNVPVHDVVIQAKAKDLLIGTHGRSIYRATLLPIYHHKTATSEGLWVQLTTEKIKKSNNWGKKRQVYSEPAIPKLKFWLYAEKAEDVMVSIMEEQTTCQQKSIKTHKGFAQYEIELRWDEEPRKAKVAKERKSKKDPKWDMTLSEDGRHYYEVGKYKLTIKNSAGKVKQADFEITK